MNRHLKEAAYGAHVMTAPDPPDILSDAARESLIDAAYQALLAATTKAERYACWWVMRSLILHRSTRQVRRMERERGLR
jgi:hypothetical protein